MSRREHLLKNLSPAELKALISELAQKFKFNTNQIEILAEAEFLRHPSLKIYLEDPLEQIVSTAQLNPPDPPGFNSQEPILSKRKVFLNAEKASKEILYHEIIHLCQHPDIFPKEYVTSKLGSILIEGITQYIAQQYYLEAKKGYQRYVALVEKTLAQDKIEFEVCRKFSFEGIIGPEIQKLYIAFLATFFEPWIIRLFNQLIEKNPEKIDLGFLELLESLQTLEKNKIIDAIVNYITNEEKTPLKEIFISNLSSLFLTRQLLGKSESESNVEILSESFKKTKDMPSGNRFVWLIPDEFFEKIYSNILYLTKVGTIASPFKKLQASDKLILIQLLSAPLLLSTLKILIMLENFSEKNNTSKGIFFRTTEHLSSYILSLISLSLSNLDKNRPDEIPDILEQLKNIHKKYLIFSHHHDFKKLKELILKYCEAVESITKIIEAENKEKLQFQLT